ncbi:adenosylcobinamide-phosphate synthase CbiB [Rhodoferax mekongensis]|uniref:adenosylcobinamide-phosphate synthase CbiB n=1 Tax=Rhodoferax mekongensis TaxID=3068341 RepID=UPI0028BF34FB|nr:adenosylcobinamide-phosphate synthase CbiB [Rhodoferax sp. TBRC 17199]MDT7515415.1 adenosylcobinamide-phosphate synthase CbiB [Rhodoferax sp. TBRC 17199]
MTPDFTPQHWAGAVGVAVLVALWVDRVWGEPPARLHPVVWMGHFLGKAGNRVQRHAAQDPEVQDFKAFGLAALIWCAGAALFLIAALLLQGAALELPWWAAGVAMGLLLKPMLALAMLKSEVRAVEAALAGSLDDGRERLRWLVSRDVTRLTEVQVRESAIETLAENLNDSLVAPVFWFLLLGLPGAVLYRFANTADAMWGYPGIYKDRNWAWAGKWAARADDVLSWVPARIAAVLLLLAAGRRGWALRSQLRAEARKTPSPNSGWPMAAMALVLGVGLRKPGVYVLNPGGREALAADTEAAQVYASKAVLALVGCALAALVLIAIGV